MSRAPLALLVFFVVGFVVEPAFVGISPSCHLFVGSPPEDSFDASTGCSDKRVVLYRIGEAEEAHVGIVDVVNNRIRLQSLHFPSRDLLLQKTPRFVWTNATVRHHFSSELDYGFAAESFVFSDGARLFVFGRNDSSGEARLFGFKVVEANETPGNAAFLEIRQIPVDLAVDGKLLPQPCIDFNTSGIFRLHFGCSRALFVDGGATLIQMNISSSECPLPICPRAGASLVDPKTAATLAEKAILYESKRRHLRMAFPHVRRLRHEHHSLRGGWLFVNGILFGTLLVALLGCVVIWRLSRTRLIN